MPSSSNQTLDNRFVSQSFTHQNQPANEVRRPNSVMTNNLSVRNAVSTRRKWTVESKLPEKVQMVAQQHASSTNRIGMGQEDKPKLIQNHMGLKTQTQAQCRVRNSLRSHMDAVRGVHFTGPNQMVSASEDCTLKVWDLQHVLTSQ